ncbi:SDR family NAD(P)-dependent oxidoreductase [Oceaniglobus trochenteri]|uniref:SDR family NAD(P)-dependent oxidoreductase n=1 Tax=Oceaniglobus trochenteri TaxID=2763260 RepID=UPI001CFF85BC|nr:SDR family NAD(P)-dependent oxidoreductase [Oceaniglobus trochenteri]
MRRGFSIEGKRVIVTGAAGGIGQAVARRLAENGARVALLDVARVADATAAFAADLPGDCRAITADVTDPNALAEAFAAVDTAFGGLDGLVNNAGITRAEDVFDITLESWRDVIDINMTGAFLCAKLAMERFRAQGEGGRIVQMGSVVGHQGALKGHLHYSASKSALHGMSRTLARTGAAFGVTVNTVAPGLVRTPLIDTAHGDGAEMAAAVPLGRLAEPSEIAAAVHFLLSDDAGYITGAVIDVNGGMHMR